MDSEKQIEEIARIIAKANGNEQNVAYYRPDATDLYNSGYCKASEVAEEIFAEIEKCSEVALMNGHIETPILCIGFGVLAELKKKYIGKDINVPTKMEDS